MFWRSDHRSADANMRTRQTSPVLANRCRLARQGRTRIERPLPARKKGTAPMSTLVQEQFGKNAAGYLTSKPHAQGKSLDRLVALTKPQPGWRVLDVATGGGHVAYAFAPHVARVWATDITPEMVDQVGREAAKKGFAN